MEQKNGQRITRPIYCNWNGPEPGVGCEIFVARLPRYIYEDSIYPIFRTIGNIYEMRLMMNFSGTNRGFCYIKYETPELAQEATKKLNEYEISSGYRIGVVLSRNFCRLRVIGLKEKLDIIEFVKVSI